MGAPAKAMPYGKLVDDSLTSGGIYIYERLK